MSNKQTQAAKTPRGFDFSSGFMQNNVVMATAAMSPILAANISLMHWNADNYRRMAEAYSQWFGFIGDRLEADASFAEKLRSLKGAEDISRACTKFMETAAKDYQVEAAKLVKISRGAIDAASDALQDTSVDRQNGAVLGE